MKTYLVAMQSVLKVLYNFSLGAGGMPAAMIKDHGTLSQVRAVAVRSSATLVRVFHQ